jgi:hypothetical protein
LDAVVLPRKAASGPFSVLPAFRLPFGCDRAWPVMTFVSNAQEEEDLRSASTFVADRVIGSRAGPDFLSGPEANDIAHDPCSRSGGDFRLTPQAGPNHLVGIKLGEKS